MFEDLKQKYVTGNKTNSAGSMFEDLKQKYVNTPNQVVIPATTTVNQNKGNNLNKNLSPFVQNTLETKTTPMFAQQQASMDIAKTVENTPSEYKKVLDTRQEDAIKKDIASVKYQMNTLMGKTDLASVSKKNALSNKLKELEAEYKNTYGKTINTDEKIMNTAQDITYGIGALGSGIVQGTWNIPKYVATAQEFVSDKTVGVLNAITGQNKQVETPFSTIKDVSGNISDKAGNVIQNAVEGASNPVSKKVVELSGAVGNMVPGIAGNIIAPGTGIGTTAFVLSAGGSYLKDAEQRGLTGGKALAYATAMGAVEGLTEKIGLGKLGKAMKSISANLIGKAITDIGAGAGINAIQEALIEPVSEGASQLLGGSYDYSNMGKRMLQAGIDGAVVYLLMGGIGSGFVKATGIGEKIANGQEVSQQEIQEALAEMESNGINVAEVQADFNNAVNTIQTYAQYRDNYANEIAQYKPQGFNRVSEPHFNKLNNMFEKNNIDKDLINYIGAKDMYTKDGNTRLYKTLDEYVDIANKNKEIVTNNKRFDTYESYSQNYQDNIKGNKVFNFDKLTELQFNTVKNMFREAGADTGLLQYIPTKDLYSYGKEGKQYKTVQEYIEIAQKNKNSIQKPNNDVTNATGITFQQTVNNMREQGYIIPQDRVDTIETFSKGRGVKVLFDNTLQDGVNGVYDGNTRTYKINPNSEQAVEFIAVHEMLHDMYGTKEYQELAKFVQEYANKTNEYSEAKQQLENTYKTFYQNNNINQEQLDIDVEATNDMVARALGNQEFLNSLAQSKPKIFERFVNWIKEIGTKLFGTDKQKFLQDLKKKFVVAYNSQYNPSNKNINHSIAGEKGLKNAIKRDNRFKRLEVNLNRAQKMASQGFDNEQIRKNTNWFQDKNGDWKFEFSDKYMKLKEGIKLIENSEHKLGDILEHDILFIIYPELIDYKVRIENMHKRGGSYNRYSDLIRINSNLKNKKAIQATLIHEIQHAIQKIEDFEGGMSSRLSKLAYYKSLGEIEANDTKRRYLQEQETNFNRDLIPPESSKLYPRHTKLEQYLNNRTTFDKIKDGIYQYFNDRGVLRNENVESFDLENKNEDTRLVVRRGHLEGLEDSSSFSLPKLQKGEVKHSLSTKLEERVQGDALLDAQDIIDEIKSVGANVDENGYVTVYHRTSKDNAKNIYKTGKMSAKEDGIFFSTNNKGVNNSNYGEAIVELKVPAEKLKLDDIFDDEASVKIPLKNKNEIIDVTEYLVTDNTNSAYNADIQYSQSNDKWQEFLDNNLGLMENVSRTYIQKQNEAIANDSLVKFEESRRKKEKTNDLPSNKVVNKIADDKKIAEKTKKELRKELLIDKNDFFIQALEDAQNRSMALMNNTDTIRNTELVFGRENGTIINDLIFQKAIDNEAESVKWQNKERQEIKELGIKARSKESAAVQKYGEKQYVNDVGEIVKYGELELASEFKDIDTQNKIKRAAQVIRNKYDNYIDIANNVLTKLGFEPIKKRNDYMRHFQELNDVFSRYGIPFNAKDMQEHILPTDINGLTEFWSPQKNYFSSMQPRKGLKTNYDAITGVDGYISGIANLIYHTEDIQRGRAFEELIRETYGEEKGFENLANLSKEEQQERIKKIQDNHLSNYAAWVHEWTNNIAGKKNKIDRSVESAFGRKVFSFLDTTRKQVGANMIGLNVASSLTNLISPIQALAKTNKIAMLKGTGDTIKNIFIKDNFAENNKFLVNRIGTDMISKNAWQKIQDAGYVFMKGVDWFSSNLITRSKYYELRAKGMSEQKASDEAGKFAARIMGDRTKGAMPQLYNSKLVGLLTQFQLEVNNQLYSQFYDTYHESKENAKGNALKTAAGITFTLGQLFAYTHLYGKLFEAIAGYNPTMDIIDIIATAFGIDDDEKEEKSVGENLKLAADKLVDALPYVNVLTGGGRIPITSGIPNIVGAITGGTDEYGREMTVGDEMKKLVYLLPPTGGGQVKKTAQGLETILAGGEYKTNADGEKQLKFATGFDDMDMTEKIGRAVQAMTFGKYSLPNAREYIDNGFKSLTVNQTKAFEETQDMGLSSKTYLTILKEVNDLKPTNGKNFVGDERKLKIANILNKHNLSKEQKSYLFKYLYSRKID